MTNMAVNPMFYTQRADAALSQTVRAIECKIPHFATDFLGRIEGGANAPASRLEAIQDSRTRLWAINRITYLPEGEGIFRQDIEARTGLCFFDALHYIARFQNTELEMGKQIVDIPGEHWQAIPGYKTAAAEAGQAIDADGEVHPCCYGRILTPGFFDNNAYKSAAGTKNRHTGDPVSTSNGAFMAAVTADLVQKVQRTNVTEGDLLMRSIDRRRVINDLKAVIATVENFNRTFKIAQGASFRSKYVRIIKDRWNNDVQISPTMTKLGSVLSLGYIPVKAYIKGNPEYAPALVVHAALGKVRKATDVLPEYPEKTLLKEFAKAAEYSIALERAASIHALCKEQKKSPHNIRKGVAFIHRAAAINNMGHTDTQRLEEVYLQDGFYPGQFINKIGDLWNGLDNKDGLHRQLYSRINLLEKNL